MNETFNFETDEYIVESQPMSNRAINDMIIHTVGRQLIDGTFHDF